MVTLPSSPSIATSRVTATTPGRRIWFSDAGTAVEQVDYRVRVTDTLAAHCYAGTGQLQPIGTHTFIYSTPLTDVAPHSFGSMTEPNPYRAAEP